jgi:hypothetical protein
MYATLDYTDYSSAIKYQSEDLEKNRKRFDRNFTFGKWVAKKLLPGLLKKLNGLLVSHLLSTKGALIELSKNIDKIEGKDLTKQINDLENWIHINISFQDAIEQLIAQNEHKEYPALVISQATLGEIIENLYTIQRVFKKHTLQTPKETSELARDLSKRSVQSLQKALYGH